MTRRGLALLLVVLLPLLGQPAAVGQPSLTAAEDGPPRLAGPDRVATAATIARDGWVDADTVVLADLFDVPSALVGGHLAARVDGPLLGSGPSVPAVTDELVDGLAPTTLIALGGVAVPDGSWDVVRLDGPDAAGLAAEAALGPADPADLPVVVAAVEDALGAANLAPAVLLLTDRDVLPAATREALEALDPPEVVVLGGEGAVGPEVAEAIAALGPTVRREAGPTRAETALATARGRDRVALAAGGDVADATAIIGWAVRRDADVLVTPHAELPATVDAHLRAGPPAEVVVVGGESAVGTFAARQAQAAATQSPPPGFRGSARPLTTEERAAMTGPVWREGCPVGLDDLVVLELDRWTFDGNVRPGRLVVAASVADAVLQAFADLFDARFPIERMDPIEAFGGDDDASMDANNSSAFNCRFVGGTQTWSQHAHGTAVDLNPVQNPYVRGSTVAPPAGAAYLDRADLRPGMVTRPGPVEEAFAAIGWGWGGDFSSSRDYQHFSATGT